MHRLHVSSVINMTPVTAIANDTPSIHPVIGPMFLV